MPQAVVDCPCALLGASAAEGTISSEGEGRFPEACKSLTEGHSPGVAAVFSRGHPQGARSIALWARRDALHITTPERVPF